MPKISVTFRDQPVSELHFSDNRCTIGRDSDNDLTVDSLAFKRHHAVVEVSSDEFIVRSVDDNATIWIGEDEIHEASFGDGDSFRIGKHLLTCELDHHLEDDANSFTELSAGLQVLGGSYVGRIIRLTEPETRIGTPGRAEAIIRRNPAGYVLHPLPGLPEPRVNGVGIDSHTYQLGNGDRVEIDDQDYHYFEVDDAEPNARLAAPQRKFTRVAFDAPAALSAGETIWTTRIIDLSLNGALVVRPGLWKDAVTDTLTLRVRLQNDDEIEMRVTVAHSHEHEIGVQCIEMQHDDIARLRHLIKLNLADDALLERELAALG